MTPSAVNPPPATPSSPGNLWQRRVVGPFKAILLQGLSPGRLAATLAVGTACSLFPFLGFTSLLNLGVGLALRMNQPVLQTLNQLLGPVQLLLIVPYVRLGEILWGVEQSGFTVEAMLTFFRDASLGGFLEKFGWAGVHALTAWLLTSPLLILALYLSLRPVFERKKLGVRS